MAKQKIKMVQCRYPKCMKLHETTELPVDEAVKGGSRSYYHPDCYHTMQTVNEIKDLFYRNIDSTITGKQIGQLVSIVNNMIFSKGIDVDYIKFALQFFINNKPGKLRYPGGIAYIVQDKDVISAWDMEKQRRIRAEIKEQQKSVVINDDFILDLPDHTEIKQTNKKSKFSSVLGV